MYKSAVKRIINFRDFNIFTLKKDFWDIVYHNHNFYEIILIVEGNGIHRVNDISFPYDAGNIFFLSPDDMHEFFIETKTEFIYIKFTENFLFKNFQNIRKESQHRIQLLAQPHLIYGKAVESVEDSRNLLELSKMLLHTYLSKKILLDDMIVHYMFLILSILADSLIENEEKISLTGEREKINQILMYLNVNATDKNKISIKNLAAEFAMSPHYISKFVKKNSGYSIQAHIMNYKMQAAEKMLSESECQISEIVDLLAFNDASHFSRTFKKYVGISPKNFRSRNFK